MRYAPIFSPIIGTFLLVGLLGALTGCWDDRGAASNIRTTPHLESISINVPDAGMPAGITQKLTATGIYSNGSKQDLSAQAVWTSSGTGVATVDPGGKVTAVSPGSTTIIAEADGVVGSATLIVTAANLVSIGVTPAARSIAAGMIQDFKATGVYSDNSAHDVTASVSWHSATPVVATIDSTGKARAVGVGATLITATLGGVSSAAVTLKVTGAILISIAVTPSIAAIPNGAQLQFTATGLFSDQSMQDLSRSANWSSSAATLASVSNTNGSNGLVTALGVGTTSITAAFAGVSSPAVTLIVNPAALVSIAVTPLTPILPLGLSAQFVAVGTYTDNSTQDITGAVIWTSSAISVATISSDLTTSGLAMSKSPGATNITATLGAVASPPVSLTVSAARLVSIAVTPPTPGIALGTNQQFAATGTYTDNSTQDLTTQATWSSGTSAVASISNASGSRGLATSLTVGSTAIGASLGTVNSTPVSLTVSAATLVSIAVTPPTPGIALGTNQQFAATGTYTDNSTQDLTTQVTWSSDSPSVASISNATASQGLATSLTVGSTAIGASLGAVASATVFLTVTAATLVSIDVTPPSLSIMHGTNQQFTATGTYTDNSTQILTTQVTWSSATPSVASISNSAGTKGLATSLAVGSTSITAVAGPVTSNAVTLTVTTGPLVSIAVTSPAPSIGLGANQQFTATGTYADNSTQDLSTQVTWFSGTSSVASISNASGSRGLATSLTLGSTVISASLGAVNSAGVTLTVTQNFTTPGPATWIVPTGVTAIQLVATGAGGGGGFYARGGSGAVVTATLSVTPGDTMVLYIGGAGSYGAGAFGGGGGGSTNVNAGTANQIIAGGGGGGGDYVVSSGSGPGGSAGGVNGNGQNGSGDHPGGGGAAGVGGTGFTVASAGNGGSGNGGSGAAADIGYGGAGGGGIGSGNGTGGIGGYAHGGGGGGGYGGGAGGAGGGGGGGGSTGPSGSTFVVGTNGGAAIHSGGNGSIVITVL
jgi:hypothetical protein